MLLYSETFSTKAQPKGSINMEIDKIISLLSLFSQHLPTIDLQFLERKKTVETGEM